MWTAMVALLALAASGMVGDAVGPAERSVRLEEGRLGMHLTAAPGLQVIPAVRQTKAAKSALRDTLAVLELCPLAARRLAAGAQGAGAVIGSVGR